jgi:hypothetical protein
MKREIQTSMTRKRAQISHSTSRWRSIMALARYAILTSLVAVSVAGVGSWLLSGTASASTSPDVTVSPQVVFPTARNYATTHHFQGTGAMVTVNVGPNTLFTPGFAVEAMECDADPASEDDCDVLTTLPYDDVTGKPVIPAANGSVTFHFLVWSPLPAAWDPASVITVGPGHPTAIWIGDDPSNWATTGLVSTPVTISARPVRPGKVDPRAGKPSTDKPGTGHPQRVAGPSLGHSNLSKSHSSSFSTTAVVAFGFACLGVGAASSAIVVKRRRRVVPS